MLSLTTLLSIASVGLLWVAYDTVRKVLVNKIERMQLLCYFEFTQCTLYLIFLLITNQFVFDPRYFAPGVVCVVLAMIGTYLLTKAISISPISSVIPFLSFLPFFTVITGYFLLGEAITPIQTVGMIVLVLASLGVNYKAKEGKKTIKKVLTGLWHDFLSERGCKYIVITSLLWALAIPFDKRAMVYVGPAGHAFYHALLTGTFFFIITKFQGKRFDKSQFIGEQSMLKVLPTLTLGSLIASSALMTQFYAYTMTYVAYVEAGKRSVSLIANLLIGALVFKEQISTFKVISTVIVLLSTIIIINPF